MCRKSILRGWCAVCFGAGILLGYKLDSLFWCGCIGAGLIILGLLLMKGR